MDSGKPGVRASWIDGRLRSSLREIEIVPKVRLGYDRLRVKQCGK
jgi:hypothetical protein